MADPLQLDAAAALVGKSEVTLRRLIKAGKIQYNKEKTPTGFIYTVDPDVVRDYYRGRDADILTSAAATATVEPETPPEDMTRPTADGAVRVAVASDNFTPGEYWQKRSENYEERFNSEVKSHAQTREDLGVWRGRAEQAQSMVAKLLPAPEGVEVHQDGTDMVARKEKNMSAEMPLILVVLLTILIVLILVGGMAFLYFRLVNHV